VDRVNDLLTDFFTYARPCKPQKRSVCLAEIVGKVIVLLSSRAQKNSVAIINRLDHSLPAVVVDPNQMQQVFLNILLNALEAVKNHGEIEITAEDIGIERKIYGEPRFSGLVDGVPYLVVCVRDSGEGMPSEVREKLFEPFFSTKTTGTGLGLAIVTSIMAEHDAFIHAESVLRRGTSIFLFFRTA
jgi:signal transduction histidine kinase